MPITQPKGGHFGLILPLCSASATVGLALYQYPVYLSFLQAKPSIAGKPLSIFWQAHVAPGIAVITGLAATSTIAGAISARWLQTHATLETTDVSKYYTWGAALALGHLVFFPLVLGPIQKMVKKGANTSEDGSEEAVEKHNREEMKSWFTFHTVRTVLLDLPALLCFAEGVALSFWVI